MNKYKILKEDHKMKKEKYSKMINVPLREEMMVEVLKVCEEKDIPISVFVRDAIKLVLKEKTEDGK